MRRLIVSTLAALTAVAALPGAAAAQATMTVPIDQSLKVGFAGRAHDIVVGNPMIADVNILESGGAIIMGKEYGMTTITAFDEAGRTVFSRKVVVVADDSNRVAYFRGPELNNYTCADTCQRTPMPGESTNAYTVGVPSFTGYDSRQRSAAQSANRN